MEKNIEIRSFAEAPTLNEDGRTIEGYAIVFGVRSNVMYDWEEGRKFVEVIERSAVTDELLDSCDIRALVEHNNQRLLARSNKGKGTLQLDIDDHGLKYRFVSPNTTHGNDIVEMVKRGDISGSSFAFRSSHENVKWEKESTGLWLRTVKGIEYIRDVTMTADPAYSQTEVTVRSIAELEQPEPEPEPKPEVRNDESYKVNLELLKLKI